MKTPTLTIQQLGLQEYVPTWQRMRDYTDNRDNNSADQLWVLEHPPVFTQGQNGKAEHVLNPGDIPIIQVDRGGQVTYHGPGQLIVYFLFDLRRYHYTVRQFVTSIEQAVIDLLADYDISANARCDAPGVYVAGAKIASLGLRIRRGCSYHGLSFNINMDLEPFLRINPCGMQNLRMTQLADLGGPTSVAEVGTQLTEYLAKQLTQQALASENAK